MPRNITRKGFEKYLSAHHEDWVGLQKHKPSCPLAVYCLDELDYAVPEVTKSTLTWDDGTPYGREKELQPWAKAFVEAVDAWEPGDNDDIYICWDGVYYIKGAVALSLLKQAP